MSIDDRQYPVLIESSEIRVAWVWGESHADAVKRASGDYELWGDAEPTDRGGLSMTMPDEYDHGMVFEHASAQGPAPLCTTCGLATWSGPDMAHDFQCPVRRAESEASAAASRRRFGSADPLPPAGRVLNVVALFEGLKVPGSPLELIEPDFYSVRLTVRPRTVTEWEAWVQLTQVDPKSLRTMATYAHGRGRFGADPKTSIDTILVGLGVPQLAAAELVTS